MYLLSFCEKIIIWWHCIMLKLVSVIYYVNIFYLHVLAASKYVIISYLHIYF